VVEGAAILFAFWFQNVFEFQDWLPG